MQRLACLPGWEWLGELARLRERVLTARGLGERRAVYQGWEELAGRRAVTHYPSDPSGSARGGPRGFPCPAP